MEYTRLGKRGLLPSRVAISLFGNEGQKDCDIEQILLSAYNSGVSFFDLARAIDVEEAVGAAFFDKRESVLLGSRTEALNHKSLMEDFSSTLSATGSDYIDLYQYKSNDFIPRVHDKNGILTQLQKLLNQKKIRSLGFITESAELAREAVLSGDWDVIQTPFNVASSQDVIDLVGLSNERDVGFLAMQPLFRGVIKDLPLAEGFLQQFLNVVPLWGVKNQGELEQVLYFSDHPPVKDEKFKEDVEHLRAFFN